MKQSSLWRLLSLLLAVVLLVSFAACGGEVEEPSLEEEEESHEELPVVATFFLNPLEPPDGSHLMVDRPNLLAKISAAYALNPDTVGWIQVPNTSIDDVVMYYDDSNEERRNYYYLRKNFEKAYSFDGSYFGDYRCHFDGTAAGLSRNTVIYGHSMDDDINGKLFSQLKKYDNRLNPDGEQFAKENPYIFFSLEEENHAWEIFAIFDTTISVPYNIPNGTDEEFLEIVSEATKKSIYIYDVDVTTEDKILTISTCTYKHDPNYPNDYRYVVMAKLVDPEEPLKDTASFEVNPSPKAP